MPSRSTHGNGPNGLAVVQAALVALGRLDREHAAAYFQVIWNVLRAPMRRALEAAAMERQTKDEESFPPFVEELFAGCKPLWEAAARARDVLTVLRARGVAVPEAARERILTEKDPTRLERWLEKAAVAASIAEVLDNPS